MILINFTSKHYLSIKLLSALLLSQSALAQPILEEVVVTAQKREESLQNTPIAVSAFTAAALKAKGIDNISQIADFTPNLIFDTTSPVSGLSSGAVVFIRGIGNTDFSLTTDPGVGTYVDGVYMSRSVGGVLDVLDVERIEVLRGPQGTLFGRNTIGGAINITSRKPTEEFNGELELTLGNFERIDARARVDIPVSESVRSSLALSSKKREGYVDRVLIGDSLGDDDELAARATVMIEPESAWSAQLNIDYSKIDEQSAGSTLAGFTTAFPNGLPGGASVIGYGLAAFGNIGAGIADLSQYITDGQEDRSFATGPTGTDLEIKGAAVTLAYGVDNFQIKYIGSYRETEGEFYRDPDNSPVAITHTLNTNYSHEQSTHELQLTGSAVDGRLQFVGGLYYFEEDGTDDVFVPVFLPTPDLAAGFPAAVNNFAVVDNNSEAVYLQLDWAFNDVWSSTAGVRHTTDDKRFAYTQYIAADINGNPLPFFPGAVNESGEFTGGLLPLVGNGSGATAREFEETTFKLGLNAQLGEQTLVYYSFSQGFKSGGFVLRYVESVPDVRTFQPETINTHEIGLKWESDSNRVRVNAAIFSSDYDEVQVTFFDQLGGPITANAGTVSIFGMELELVALLSDALKFELALGHTNAEYDEVNPISGLSLAIDNSASLVNTPENSASLGLEYTMPLGANELVFRLDYAYTDDVFNDSQNSPFLFQSSYTTANASLSYSHSEAFDVAAFVRNLTDERYIESGDSNYGLGFHEANYNRPREYGVTARYRF